MCLHSRWFGKCWHIHNMLKYEFEVEFDVSIGVLCIFGFCIMMALI